MRRIGILILTIAAFISFKTSLAEATNLKGYLIQESNFYNMKEDIELQKAKAQIQLLKQVLEEFKVQTPEEAAELWAEGEKTRNGVFHYVAACDELKNKISKELGSIEDNLWVIGTSSPWVKSYKIMPKKEIDKNTYEIKIIYYWTSSAGEITPSETILNITKQKDSWCVNDVKY